MGCGSSTAAEETTGIVPSADKASTNAPAPIADAAAAPTSQASESKSADEADEFDFAAAAKVRPAKVLSGSDDAEGGKSFRPPPDNVFGVEALKYSRGNKPYVGAIRFPTAANEKPSAELPDKNLQLEWIYGITPSTRNVAVFNDSNEIVYPAAAIGIIYNPTNHSQRFFRSHSDDICSIAVNNKSRSIIATGQKSTIEDEKSSPPVICVWDTKDGEQIARFQLKLSDRFVRCLAFSVDGKYLAAVLGDDKNSIHVFDWEENKKITEVQNDGTEIYSIKWCNTDLNEFITVGKNVIKEWTMNGNTLDGKKVGLSAAGIPLQPFYCIAYTAKGSALVGAQDGSLLVIKAGTVSSSVKLNHGKILSIDIAENGSIYVGTSEKLLISLDKTLKILKTMEFGSKVTTVHSYNGKLLVGTDQSNIYLFSSPDSEIAEGGKLPIPVVTGHSDGELWAITAGLGSSAGSFFSAGEDNSLRQWDSVSHRQVGYHKLDEKKSAAPKVAKASTTSTKPVNQQARAISLSPDGAHLAVGLNDGHLAVYNAASLDRLFLLDLNSHGKRQVTDQTGNWIQTISHSPDGRFLAVGTHGSIIALLDVKAEYKIAGIIKSHNSFISNLDWSADSRYIQSNCGAYELLFHDVSNPKQPQQVTDPDTVKDVDWATNSLCFSYATQGIFPVGADGTDVNTAAANASKTLVASGDDRGLVRLFRYPVANLRAESRVGNGHSSHVTRVQFQSNGETLLSAGGGDLCVFQWKIV